ncbi:putative deoxyribonuclease RhsA [Tsuneonella dongtanensis]|uniref:Putative deoxyribonuclease RhsA n=2 Tax=Tsuneonella dongtanensis TaxID=692370 RepID=A0A1B2AB36_9SPHN|nr:putative deoxyribonuclease RhsA [Tsuneonella dongtanensis]
MPPASRIGDMHTCPMATPGTPPIPHVGGPIVKGQPNVITVGVPQARVSDQCVCVGPPDIIVKGSATVLVGGLPAARMGDNTAHGGVIVVGAPTVLIGDGSNGGGGGGGGGAGMPGNVPFSQPNLQMKTFINAHKEAKPYCAVCNQ